MKERNINYLRRYKDDIRLISQKYETSVEEVEEIIDDFYLNFKQFLTDPRLPTIKISNIGTFKPTIGKIEFNLKKAIEFYKKGYLSKEKAAARFLTLGPIRRRLKKEKQGIHTWKEWRDMYKEKKKVSVKKEKNQKPISEGQGPERNNGGC